MLRDEQVLEAPILLQHDFQPVEIAERLVHVGLVDLDIAASWTAGLRGMTRSTADFRMTCALTTVSCGTSMTRSPSIVAEQDRRRFSASPRNAVVAILLRAARRDMRIGGHDLVLAKLPSCTLDLASPARGATTADALDIDAERARGVEHRRPFRKAPALAGWHEQDEGIGGTGVHRFLASGSRRTRMLTPAPAWLRDHRDGDRRQTRRPGRDGDRGRGRMFAGLVVLVRP